MATMKTMATVNNNENKCAMNNSITIKKNWNDAQQQAAHHAQQVHQWRRWLRRLRGAQHALSLHISRIVHSLCWWYSSHTHGSSSEQSHCFPRSYSWRVLFDSTSPFFLYFSFLSFSVYFLHTELFLELDNPVVMASLRYSAADESEDTLNAFSHRLWAQPPDLRRAQRLISSLLLHDPFHGPGRGWRDTRRDAHSGTPWTSRLLRTRRHVSQSVVVCNVRWIRATWWRENGRSIRKIWCHI